jgi:mRNA interferase RelE/StbE
LDWSVKLSGVAGKQFKKLAIQDQIRIRDFFITRVANNENPRRLGEALQGNRFAGLWKYRIGNFRVICKIEDSIITIIVVSIGNRRDVYKRK